MKKITFLIFQLLGLGLMGQIAVLPDSEINKQAEIVFYGVVVKQTEIGVPNKKKDTFVKSDIKILNVFKNSYTDTIISIITGWKSYDQYGNLITYSEGTDWTPQIGLAAIFFVNKSPFVDGCYQLYAEYHSVGILSPKESFFNHKTFKKQSELYRHISKLEGIQIPDSLMDEKIYERKAREDSLAFRELQRKQREAFRLRIKKEYAQNDSFATKENLGKDFYQLSRDEQTAYREKYTAARDSVIQLQQERNRKKKAQNQKIAAINLNVRFANPRYTPSTVSGVLKNFEFDVELSASQTVHLTNVPIWIKYNEGVFGSFASGASSIRLLFENNNDYTDPDFNKKDISGNEMVFTIGLDYLRTQVTTVAITPTFQKYAHVIMEMNKCTELPNVVVGNITNMGFASMYTILPNIPITEEVEFFDNLSADNFIFNDYCGPMITDFYPKQITAGTESKLTIIGSNFGNVKGELKFFNANSDLLTPQKGLNFSDLTWTDTRVEYVVHSASSPTHTTVGSGKFKLITSNNDSIDAPHDLKVDYAITNMFLEMKPYPKFHAQPYMDNDNPFVFRIARDNRYLDATPVIIKAIKDLSCHTGINFTYDTIPSDMVYQNKNDGICIIGFQDKTTDSTFQRHATWAAYHTGHMTQLCGKNNDNKYWTNVVDSDIIINTGFKFNYDTTGANIPADEYPFYDVILHELGHAAGLGHIVSSYLLMKPVTNTGVSVAQRYHLGKHWDETVKQGVDWMFTEGAKIDYTGSNCSEHYPMLRSDCYTQAIGITDQTFYGSISLYNNPAYGGMVGLKFHTLKPERIHIKLIDPMGKTLQMSEKQYDMGETYQEFDLSGHSTGIYGLIVQKDNDTQMFKIVKP